MKETEKLMDALVDLVDGVSKKNNDLSFSEFEKLYSLAQDLVLVTASVYNLINRGKTIPEEIYSNVIRLHNSAIDYIEAMKEIINKEEN